MVKFLTVIIIECEMPTHANFTIVVFILRCEERFLKIVKN